MLSLNTQSGTANGELSATGFFTKDRSCRMTLDSTNMAAIKEETFEQIFTAAGSSTARVIGTLWMRTSCNFNTQIKISSDTENPTLSDNSGSYDLFITGFLQAYPDDWDSTGLLKLSPTYHAYDSVRINSPSELYLDIAIDVYDWATLPDTITMTQNIILTVE